MSMSYRISGFLITISIAVIGWLIWPPLAALWSIQRTTDVVRRFLSRRVSWPPKTRQLVKVEPCP
jgi:hypothetical protein